MCVFCKKHVFPLSFFLHFHARRKDEMRAALKAIKKKIDDEDRARKAAVMGDVVEAAKVQVLRIKVKGLIDGLSWMVLIV